MSLLVYNTLTGKKEAIKPLENNLIRMYVCGVTVYDHCHIGHARNAVVFDIIYRYLLHKGYEVRYVRNFTDIDDKIINKAMEEKTSWKEISEKYIRSFNEDMEALNILKPTFEPRATEHIDDMINLVDTLVKKGHAYVEKGNVYFSVESYTRYGELSKRTKEEMLSGARVEIDDKKRNPLDFALWKASKENEPYWESPFGKGRPGWHIECSAMSTKYLGNPFDIHGGGMDLIFPHHENERAQTEAATGKKFVHIWVHNGFVNIEKEKMSKSLGNILLIKDFLELYHPDVLRLFFLSTHYRSPIDYSEKSIEDARLALERIYYTARRAEEFLSNFEGQPTSKEEIEELKKRFFVALDDDFNTASALSYIFEIVRIINRMLDERDESNHAFVSYAYRELVILLSLLGLFRDDPHIFEQKEKTRYLKRVGIDMEYLESLLKERDLARKKKDFKKADNIREELFRKGIILLDKPDGTEWRIK